MTSDELKGRVGVLAYRDKIVVHGNHRLVSGAHLNLDDAVGVAANDADAIGQATRAALARYKSNMPMPVWSEIKGRHEKSIAIAAGARSFSAMMKDGSKAVSVLLYTETIVLHPWKQEGLNFVGTGNDGASDISVPTSVTNKELGAAVVAALERAQ
jgi:CDI immunity protein